MPDGHQAQRQIVWATSSYSRLYTLLLRVAEYQPVATSATLNLLGQSIEQAQATADATEAPIQEIKGDLNLHE